MSKSGPRAAGSLLAAALAVAGLSVATGSASAAPAPAAAPQIIPKPVAMTTSAGSFQLTAKTRIAITSAAAEPVAADLAADLSPATGFPLPVTAKAVRSGDIQLVIGDPGTLGGDTLHEGYQLTVAKHHVTLVAPTAHGLFNGVQTIRQLLPAQIAGTSVTSGPWTMPAVSITDYPRYEYRGYMLDIARHYESPAAVERLIDLASQYKINTFHLHLSDDQGFRVVIDGFPNLTAIGGQGSVGTHGRTMDPGGFWTQAQYKHVVAYAQARFMTVVPEVDSPSHNNAIVMSEYNDVANPRLNGHPQDINCGISDPPSWNYTGDVGYSGMCPESENTWAIYSAIISQLSAMSTSKYYNLGGDEAHQFTAAKYAAFVNRESPIVTALGKTPMGWADGYATTAGTTPPPGSVAESWLTGATDAAAAVQKGMKVVMAPADHTYLDQTYPNDNSGLGLSWACRKCDLDKAYNWEPGGFPGVPDSSVIGVEGALWAETIPALQDAEYMTLPRLPAIAEIGWSPKAARTGVTSPAFVDFALRVAAQGPRWQAAGLNFYVSKEVPWRLTGAAANAGVNRNGQVTGTLALVSAPGLAPGSVTATIDWGDGHSSAGTLTGTAPQPARTNGLYALTGSHRYRTGASHTVTVTLTAADGRTGTFTVTV